MARVIVNFPDGLRATRSEGDRERLQVVKPPRVLRAVDSPDRGDPLAEVMAKCSQGDQGAFVRLYDELSPLVYGICRKVIRDPAQSEEVTQEVFTEIWRLAPRFEQGRGSVKSWVATIAHRRAVDRVRSEQSARDREQRYAVKLVVDVSSGVENEVEDDLERQRVRVALELLTDVQRKAIELAYYGGYTYREVAVLLEVPEGTIKTRIRDGLVRLRDEMGVIE